MRLTILHFNDLHGRLDQLPRLYTLIDRERARARADGRHTLVLDGGDSSDRTCWESDLTKGRANYALLAAMNVDASVVGNGEALQWGRAALTRLIAGAAVPVLAANLVDCADAARPAVPGLRRSHVFAIDGRRVGLVGATAQYGGGYTRFGYDSIDPAPALRREVAELRGQGAQAIILLSHLGSDHDFDTKDPQYYHDEDAARDVPDLTAIVGGHTHTRLAAPLVVAGVPIVQAGDYGQWLGRLDLDVDEDTGRARAFHGQLIACDQSVSPDPTISATLDLVREEAAGLLAARLGTAARDLPHHLDQPSEFANQIADALRDVSPADLAIFFGGFARRGLAAGPITRRDLYEALPDPVHVTAAEVSGQQIWRMVERMLGSKWRTESYAPHRGLPPLGLPAHSANVRLHYDLPAGAAGQPALRAIAIDGRPLDPARRYRLASTYTTLSEETDPEFDFAGLEPGQRVENVRVESVLWELIEEWVRARGTVG